MHQAGLISPDEMRKRLDAHEEPDVWREKTLDQKESTEGKGLSPRREFKERMELLKRRNDKMDERSKLPWKGFKK